ncbi:hypothetical protein DFS34DRAFT_629063 [Phlyctochytrium arcticum]|nr:hypothetical protein DFS34DRAFT_629063 [Phlyctochytrium arcticum]
MPRTAKLPVALASLPLLEILNRDCSRANQPFTEKSDDARTLRTIFRYELATKWTDVPATLKSITKHYRNGKESAVGKYIGRLATFLKKAGAKDLGVTPARLAKIVAAYNTKARDLQKPAKDSREQGQLSEREAGRDVHVPWPDLRAAAERYWEEIKDQFYSASVGKTLYNKLLSAVILMLCVRYYNIRSAWVTIKRDFHSTTENGYFWPETDAACCWLVFNQRKNNTTQVMQLLPEPGDPEGHLLCTRERQPLTAKSFVERINRLWRDLLGKPIGVSDMRRAQITWLETEITDPLKRQEIPKLMHHSQAEHSLYFRGVLVNPKHLLQDTSEEQEPEQEEQEPEQDEDAITAMETETSSKSQ